MPRRVPRADVAPKKHRRYALRTVTVQPSVIGMKAGIRLQVNGCFGYQGNTPHQIARLMPGIVIQPLQQPRQHLVDEWHDKLVAVADTNLQYICLLVAAG